MAKSTRNKSVENFARAAATGHGKRVDDVRMQLPSCEEQSRGVRAQFEAFTPRRGGMCTVGEERGGAGTQLSAPDGDRGGFRWRLSAFNSITDIQFRFSYQVTRVALSGPSAARWGTGKRIFY